MPLLVEGDPYYKAECRAYELRVWGKALRDLESMP